MTPFTQFLIVCAILFCITVCVVDRIEVTRHNRLLLEESIQSRIDDPDDHTLVTRYLRTIELVYGPQNELVPFVGEDMKKIIQPKN